MLALQTALLPLGEAMVMQLTAVPQIVWTDCRLTYLFTSAIGTVTANAKPTLIAVAPEGGGRLLQSIKS